MKNIHLIPTNKPSRLAKHSSGSFHIVSYIAHKKGLYKMTNQNIYITSDEEIKEGDWVLNTNTNLIAKYTGHGSMDWWVKIILTTDPNLGGVQAIDDEFLEWFVKNPSCEEVKLDSTCKCVECGSSVKSSCEYAYKCNPQIFYKIIIPQEELKQETLEEAAERYSKEYYASREPYLKEQYASRVSFIEGAKWQVERMYTYDEMRTIAYNAYCLGQLDSPTEGKFNKWIQQFKKK
jgi:hypothetical protein